MLSWLVVEDLEWSVGQVDQGGPRWDQPSPGNKTGAHPLKSGMLCGPRTISGSLTVMLSRQLFCCVASDLIFIARQGGAVAVSQVTKSGFLHHEAHVRFYA